jgi:alkylhydroperoxidase/carboxymuconolactone decarboxylase family protein YurZ
MSLPKPYVKFGERYPDILRDFEDLSVKCLETGPLDPKSRRLVKLGMVIATGSKGAMKSQTRKAMESGFSQDEIRHAAVLALPTIGFPAMIAALGWMEEAFAE